MPPVTGSIPSLCKYIPPGAQPGASCTTTGAGVGGLQEGTPGGPIPGVHNVQPGSPERQPSQPNVGPACKDGKSGPGCGPAPVISGGLIEGTPGGPIPGVHNVKPIQPGQSQTYQPSASPSCIYNADGKPGPGCGSAPVISGGLIEGTPGGLIPGVHNVQSGPSQPSHPIVGPVCKYTPGGKVGSGCSSPSSGGLIEGSPGAPIPGTQIVSPGTPSYPKPPVTGPSCSYVKGKPSAGCGGQPGTIEGIPGSPGTGIPGIFPGPNGSIHNSIPATSVTGPIWSPDGEVINKPTGGSGNYMYIVFITLTEQYFEFRTDGYATGSVAVQKQPGSAFIPVVSSGPSDGPIVYKDKSNDYPQTGPNVPTPGPSQGSNIVFTEQKPTSGGGFGGTSNDY